LQSPLFQVDISQIIVHEADEPNAVIDFLDSKLLSGQYGGDVDLLAIDAEVAAIGDERLPVVEGIVDLRQAPIGA
jgi:hypothetical protein